MQITHIFVGRLVGSSAPCADEHREGPMPSLHGGQLVWDTSLSCHVSSVGTCEAREEGSTEAETLLRILMP